MSRKVGQIDDIFAPIKSRTKNKLYMNTIGFKNFRRFKDLAPLSLSGVTFFVGGNNAGKSTVVKGIILFLENLKNDGKLSNIKGNVFDFPKFSLNSYKFNEIHIGTYNRAFSKSNRDSNEIKFISQLESYNLCYTLTGDLESKSPYADVSVIEIVHLESGRKYIFNFQTKDATITFNSNDLREFARKVDISTDDELFEDELLENNNTKEYSYFSLPNNENSLFEELEHRKELLIAELNTTDDIIKVARINNELESIEKRLKGYDPFGGHLENKNITFSCNLGTPRAHFAGYLLSNLFETFNNNSLHDAILNDILNLEETESIDTIENNAILEANVLMAFQQMVYFDLENLLRTIMLKDIYYIPAHSVSQKVVFSSEDTGDYMTNVIKEFQQNNIVKGSEEDNFVTTWMKNLNIGIGYNISTIEGEAYTINIENFQGGTMPLSDFGMGSNQMIMLLLKLATIIKSDNIGHPPTIIIEEPEQNVHPKLQSTLTELFEYVHSRYNFNIIIETHSEYMIRKSQAMIADGSVKFEENPFKVYYFPEEGEPYDMIYRQSGMFENKFDEGFFDEAGRQHIVVMKKARELQ